MKRNLLAFLFVFGILIFIILASAVDFTPQGDIDLKGVYAIKNATNITAEYFCNATSCKTLSDLEDTDTTYTAGSNLSLVGTIFSVNMTSVQNFFDTIYQAIGSYLTAATNFGGEVSGNASNIVLDNDALDDQYIELGDSFGGDVSGTYDNLQVSDNSHLLDAANITNDGWIEDSELPLANRTSPYCGNITGATSNLCTLTDSDTTYTAGSNLSLVGTEFAVNTTSLQDWLDSIYQAIGNYLTTATNFGGEASGTYDAIVLNNDALDDQYVELTDLPLANQTLPYCGNVTGSDFNLCVNPDTTIGNCSGDGTCSNIIYQSELPLANKTTPYCGNITGATSNLCTLTDSDTTYSNGSGISLVGTEFNHSDTSSQASSDNSGNTFIQDLTLDTYGHLTSLVTAAVDFASFWDTSTDLDTVISADEISEANIEFTTACASGNHYYLSGNDLACETDADTTYTNGSAISLVGTQFNLSTCADNQIWKMNGAVWNCEADDAGAGAYTWNLSGDSGTQQVIDTTNVVDIAGGTNGIDTVVGATDTVTINLDWTEVANDAISEAKIDMDTACAAGNHLYVSGNNFACEADDDTTYTNGSGISLVGTEFNHSDTSSQASSDNSGNTFIQDIVLDGFGHITSLVTAAVDFASFWDTSTDLDTVISADEISEANIEFTTACAAGNHFYLSGNDLACEADDDTTYSAGNGISLTTTTFSVAGGTCLTQDASGLSVTADCVADTQLAFNTGQHLTTTSAVTFLTVDTGQGANELYDMDQNVLTSSNVDFNQLNVSDHFRINTANITCFNSGCTWFTNATDSCMYWPSGGKDCGAA